MQQTRNTSRRPRRSAVTATRPRPMIEPMPRILTNCNACLPSKPLDNADDAKYAYGSTTGNETSKIPQYIHAKVCDRTACRSEIVIASVVGNPGWRTSSGNSPRFSSGESDKSRDPDNPTRTARQAQILNVTRQSPIDESASVIGPIRNVPTPMPEAAMPEARPPQVTNHR